MTKISFLLYILMFLFIGCKNNDSGEEKEQITKSESGSVAKNNNSGNKYLKEGLNYQAASNMEKAGKSFLKACDLKNGKGCRMLGMQYLMGLGVTKNIKKSVEYYIKACDLKDGAGCFSAGQQINFGFGGVKKDVAKAKVLFKKACDLKIKSACNK